MQSGSPTNRDRSQVENAPESAPILSRSRWKRPGIRRIRDWRRLVETTGTSLLLHAGLVLICSLIVIQTPVWDEVFSSVLRFDEGNADTEIITVVPLSDLGDSSDQDSPAIAGLLAPTEQLAMNVNDLDPAIKVEDLSGPVLMAIDFNNEMAGRSEAARKALVSRHGGTAASEAAVSAGLQWLAKHQFDDGGWSFDHASHPECDGKCTQPGSMSECRIAATGLALITFLGAGHTPREGRYQSHVDKGLKFLSLAGASTSEGLDLRGELAAGHTHAAFYSHALGALALCEAYAMTQDADLKPLAQGAVNYIVANQDPEGGGWRYAPKQAGDTSVVGWQVMALKSARNSGLNVPEETLAKAKAFLDQVERAAGARYVYIDQDDQRPKASMTAVGLLCRMYLGWRPQHPAVKRGVQYLDVTKPSRNDMYYNYYATQVVHHHGGEEWTRWNDFLREHLIQTQRKEQDGHLAGSWNIADPHGGSGGRLYMTCLAVMTLEVYYRYLPLYGKDAVK